MKRALYILLAIAIAILPSCSEHNIYREDIAICRVGERYFDTIQEAVDHIASSRAIGEDRTVYVLRDVLRGEYSEDKRKGVTVPASFRGGLRIDFMGHRYDFSSNEQYFFRFLGGDSIEVVNGTSVIFSDSVSQESALIVGTRTVTIDEHLIQDLRRTRNAIHVTAAGSLAVKADDNAKAGFAGNVTIAEGGVIELRGGTFSVEGIDESGNAYIRIYSGDIAFPHSIEARIEDAIAAVPDAEKGEVTKTTSHGPTFILHEAVAPTCYTKGYPEYYECSVCGKLFKDIGLTEETTLDELAIPMLEHVLEYHQANSQTCTEPGNKEYWQCTLCQHYFRDEGAEHEIQLEDTVIPANGHQYPEDWTIVNEATCTETGLRTKTCRICGYVLEEVIPALGHSYGEWYVEIPATCTEDGLEKRVCTICGSFETRPLPALGHDLGAWYESHPATCTEEGEERRDCSRCDYYETRSIPALGHTKSSIHGQDDPNQHWYHCDVDNVDFGYEDHTYGPWESTEKPGMSSQRTCTVCGHVDYTELEHIWHYVEAVEPDCTESGNLGYWYCDLHQGEYTSDEEHNNYVQWGDIFRPALGHSMEYHEYMAETCREDGSIEYWHCTRCGRNYLDSAGEREAGTIVIPHHTVEAVGYKAPTCTEDGNIAYWHCIEEDRYFSDEACTNKITLAQTVIKALGHDHSGPWVTIDATYHWKVCAREGCDVILDKAEHSFEITYDYEASNRNLTMTSVCIHCHREQSSTTTSDTGAFDISTVVGPITVKRLTESSWILSADETEVRYCSWSGEDGVTILTGPEPFTISCEIPGSGKYKIFCHVLDRYGKETDLYLVELTKYR